MATSLVRHDGGRAPVDLSRPCSRQRRSAGELARSAIRAASTRDDTDSLPRIELTWSSPVILAEIHLTFDSGFQRELTLSASDSTNRKVVRGPQPELVRDYEILLDGRSIVTVDNNTLRKRVHRLPASVSARGLRLVVKTTHGVPQARLFELRAYAR